MTNERLDQIEDELETTKQLLVSVASVVESNRDSISDLTDQIDRLTNLVDRLAVRHESTQLTVERLAVTVERLTLRLDRLAESQQTTQASVDQLARLMMQFAQNAEADRAEIRRVWDYLNQQSNGGGEGL